MRNYFLFILGFTILSASSLAEAGQVHHIRQNQSRQDGVWVSHPHAEDQAISNVLQVSRVDTLTGYAEWLKRHVQRKKDTGDTWALPLETLKRRYGDCEDFALLNQAVLRVLGVPAEVLVLDSGEIAHAVCVFKLGDQYATLDFAKLHVSSLTKREAFLKHLRRSKNAQGVYTLERTA